jgi:hypothetical protein
MTLNFLHYYLVQGNGAVYRYMFSAGKSGVSEKEPARQEVFGTIASSDEYFQEDLQPVQQEIIGYVIHTGKNNAAMVQPEQTEMLRKIKI